MHWLHLAIAIISEIIGTTALKSVDGLAHWKPLLLVALGYSAAVYFSSLALRVIPLGITYAIWSGVGVVLMTLVAWALYRQALDAGAIIGISLIVAGVVVINLFSMAKLP